MLSILSRLSDAKKKKNKTKNKKQGIFVPHEPVKQPISTLFVDSNGEGEERRKTRIIEVYAMVASSFVRGF